MSRPLVSIIMPAYNREEWLPLSIGSVRRQTFCDWELLVVDDRSTDQTRSLIRQWQNDDCRIRYLANERAKGPSGARNQGLSVAQAKYIAYLDSDDEWEPFHLQTMVEYLERHDNRIDIMTANPLRKRRATREVFNYDELDLSAYSYERIQDGYLFDPRTVFDKQLRGRVLTTQALVGRSEFIKQTHWNESLCGPDDCLYNLELCARSPNVCHLQAYHVIYWAHDTNITNCSGGRSPQQMEALNGNFIRYLEYILETYPLTAEQDGKVRNDLSRALAWQMAYAVYEPQGKYRSARECYRKAIRLTPTEWGLWKAYLSTWVKQCVRKTPHFIV